MTKYVGIIMLICFSFACKNSSQVSGESEETAPVIVYKTTVDYSDNVPVIMNADKTKIISYPAPNDLKNGNKLRVPEKLVNGYFLDHRGISINVVFTSYTYPEYVKMQQAPSLDELRKSIIDIDPIIEMYNCKDALKNKCTATRINRLIKSNFKGCVKLK